MGWQPRHRFLVINSESVVIQIWQPSLELMRLGLTIPMRRFLLFLGALLDCRCTAVHNFIFEHDVEGKQLFIAQGLPAACPQLIL